MIDLKELWDFLIGYGYKALEKTGGLGLYTLFEIDLSEAREDEKYQFVGDRLIVTQIDSDASMRLHHYENPEIDLNIVRSIKTPFKQFYITNEAKSGTLKILAGGEGIFDALQEIRNPSDVSGHIFDISLDELAVRLGAPSQFDRRGDTVFNENFEGSVIRWDTAIVPAGGSVAVATNTAFTGTQSCKMVTNNTNGASCLVRRFFTLPVDTKLGFEISWAPIGDKFLFKSDVDIWTGEKIFESQIKYVEDTTTLTIADSNGSDVTIDSGMTSLPDMHLFNNMKVVIDTATGKYVRVLFNEKSYDVSEYGLKETNFSSNKGLRVQIQLLAEEAVAKTTYLDHVIITQNEP